MTSAGKIRPRVRDAIIQSLQAGVTPRIGQTHIQVGRAAEVQALIRDIDRIGDGGSCFRLVIGDYGSGKTFFPEPSTVGRSGEKARHRAGRSES